VTSIRRLTAILAADVAGYSRLMGTHEEETHERLKAHLTELVNPRIAEHSGRVVKNTGDGFLAEFASVVDAVRCAAEIQRGMADREPEVAEACCQVNSSRSEKPESRMGDHTAATAFRHSLAASARKIRSVDRETRWR
jgi:class 3 adenylate cyclase